MSSSEHLHTSRRRGASVHERPPVGYVCRVDDDNDPSELTISDPSASDVTTNWLTIDVAHAVSLDEWR